MDSSVKNALKLTYEHLFHAKIAGTAPPGPHAEEGEERRLGNGRGGEGLKGMEDGRDRRMEGNGIGTEN
jgi:hypothetical protein